LPLTKAAVVAVVSSVVTQAFHLDPKHSISSRSNEFLRCVAYGHGKGTTTSST